MIVAETLQYHHTRGLLVRIGFHLRLVRTELSRNFLLGQRRVEPGQQCLFNKALNIRQRPIRAFGVVRMIPGGADGRRAIAETRPARAA